MNALVPILNAESSVEDWATRITAAWQDGGASLVMGNKVSSHSGIPRHTPL
jgi:hypothetical protein